MKDEFLNERMLNILIDQKRYLEAFRVYKNLIREGIITDPAKYQGLLKEVERIDPVLTMDRATREKKVSRLTKILNNIRRTIQLRRDKLITSKTAARQIEIAPPAVATPIESRIEEEGSKSSPDLSHKGKDVIQIIEELTIRSIRSVLDIICGNFSKEVLSKMPKAKRIEILNEMLRRIEVLKSQNKKEFTNV